MTNFSVTSLCLPPPDGVILIGPIKGEKGRMGIVTGYHRVLAICLRFEEPHSFHIS